MNIFLTYDFAHTQVTKVALIELSTGDTSIYCEGTLGR